MEVDPRKLEEEEKKREENLANLEKNCGDVLDVIVERFVVFLFVGGIVGLFFAIGVEKKK